MKAILVIKKTRAFTNDERLALLKTWQVYVEKPEIFSEGVQEIESDYQLKDIMSALRGFTALEVEGKVIKE